MLIHTPADLAQFCRDQRKLRCQSQASVAEVATLRQDTVSKFELSPANARIETLFRLLSALDLELHLAPKGTDGAATGTSGWSEPW